MDNKDLQILEKYHEKLEKMVLNQAISNFDPKMKAEIVDILQRHDRMTGMCSHCNSHLLSIAAAAVRLYNENKNTKPNNNGSDTRKKGGRKKTV